MKKLFTFFMLFLVFMLKSNVAYSLLSPTSEINIKGKDGSINYAEKMRLEKEIDSKLEIFFNAIRGHRNKYVKSHLKTEENLKSIENFIKENTKSGIYGPGSDYTLFPMGDTTLIDVNTRDRYGYTPIIVAIESKNDEILEILIENGVDIREKHPVFGKLTLHTAAYFQNETAVKMLLKLDPTLANSQSGTDGWTPLQDATLKSNSKIVKLLLDYGADPLIKDYKGGTAMDMATEFGKGEIVKLLRDKIKSNRR